MVEESDLEYADLWQSGIMFPSHAPDSVFSQSIEPANFIASSPSGRRPVALSGGVRRDSTPLHTLNREVRMCFFLNERTSNFRRVDLALESHYVSSSYTINYIT